MGFKHWTNIRNQDFISIALSSKRSVTEVKWGLVTEWYSCPNHNICATPSVYLINTASGKSFILTSPNLYSTRLCENGLHARRPFRGPLITPRHRRQRLAWARTHLQWTRQRWQEVLFSDESHDQTHCSWFETSVWGVQQYFDGNWIVEQLLWSICLLSTYPKLGCDHYYSDLYWTMILPTLKL
jgi:hypothetical protein